MTGYDMGKNVIFLTVLLMICMIICIRAFGDEFELRWEKDEPKAIVIVTEGLGYRYEVDVESGENTVVYEDNNVRDYYDFELDNDEDCGSMESLDEGGDDIAERSNDEWSAD